MAKLYMVASPIGNLRDISFRAIDTLKEAGAIACEDTRHSLKLLNAYEIRKPLIPCHAHNEDRGAQRVIGELRAGNDVAYLSDAGTPGISDPGNVLVAAVLEAGFDVVPIPGASALASVLSVAGLPGKRIAFEGFLSPKPGRRRRQLSELLVSAELCVLYESPHRILALLRDLKGIDPEANIVLGREVTKIHEEFLRGNAEDVITVLESRPGEVKGEIVLLIHSTLGATSEKQRDNESGGDENT